MKPTEIIEDIKKGCGSEFSVNDKLCPICQSKLQIAKQMQESFIEMIDEIKEDIKLTCKLYTHKSGEELSAEIIEKIDKTLKQEVEE